MTDEYHYEVRRVPINWADDEHNYPRFGNTDGLMLGDWDSIALERRVTLGVSEFVEVVIRRHGPWR